MSLLRPAVVKKRKNSKTQTPCIHHIDIYHPQIYTILSPEIWISSGISRHRTDALELAEWMGDHWETRRFESGVGGGARMEPLEKRL